MLYDFIGKMTVIVFLEFVCIILWNNCQPVAMVVNMVLVIIAIDYIEAVIKSKKEEKDGDV